MSLEHLEGAFFRFAARELLREIVHIHHQGSFGQVGAKVAGALEGALQEEPDRAVVSTHRIVNEVPAEAKLGPRGRAWLPLAVRPVATARELWDRKVDRAGRGSYPPVKSAQGR